MPTVKDGKVSLNLKVSEEQYKRWVKKAGELGVLNMSEFIRSMVEKGVSNGSKQGTSCS